MHGTMLEALVAYHANVQVCLNISSVGTSAESPSIMGVKQGCPLSPILFGLYNYQLELHLKAHAQDGPELRGQKVPILMSADDIVLLSKSPSGLQHLLPVSTCAPTILC